MKEHFYLDGTDVKIERTSFYNVRLSSADKSFTEELEPKRLFPVTYLDRYIIFVDEDGNEKAFLSDAKNLSDESKKALKKCLDDIYRIPKITKFVSYENKYRLYWNVETDKGPVKFHVHSIRYDIKRIGNRILVRDYLDNRYEIPDYKKLDKRSIRLLESFF